MSAPVIDVPALAAAAELSAGTIGLITTALLLGIRHGFDWDHLAAITDVTSTTTTAEAAELDHESVHAQAALALPATALPATAMSATVPATAVPATVVPATAVSALAVPATAVHAHGHGGAAERAAHATVPDGSVHPHQTAAPRLIDEQKRGLLLGTLYALGHATVVAFLGLLALWFGAILPAWVDQVMGPVVGATLVFLGVWVFVSLYQYARHGREFRLRSRWMLVFDSARYGWRRFQAWLHGHEHVDPMEMSSYGKRTAFGVGMIHGVGAETGTQVLLIAAIGGASSQGLGVPMMLAFIVGLLISNTIVVVVTATGFIASRFRERLYVVLGVIAGTFSLVIGAIFLLGLDGQLPSIEAWLFGGGA